MNEQQTEQARDTGGLREALAFTHSAIHSGENCNGAVHDMVERALSQGAAHEERGLDVERLTRAMIARLPYGNWTDHLTENIKRVAAEYARLATPEAAHPDDGHEHSWGCRRCGVDPSPSQLAATLDLAHPAHEERGLDRLRLLETVAERAEQVWEALRHEDHGHILYDLGRALAALAATPEAAPNE